MRAKTSSPALVFEKVLRAFETGGFTYVDVVAQLKRLLASGASPTELLEILRREELMEPLPEHARMKVLGLLNDAIARAPAAVSDEVKNADPGTAPDRPPDSTPAPMRSTSPAASVQQAEAPAKETPVPLTSVFEKVLNAIETRDFTDADVLAELQRLLLVTGASPAALLEILRRRRLIEPLPENAYAEVLGLLNDAMGRAGVPAEFDEVQKAAPPAATRQIPDSVPMPPRSAPMAPPVEQTKRAAKASVAVTSLRNPDLSSMATPNRATTDSAPPATPIQIAAPKQTAHPAASRIPTTSPAKAPGPAPIVTPGPVPAIGLSRSPAEGPRVAVTPTRSPPPNSAPSKSGTPTPAPVQTTASSSPPESTSTRVPAMEQTAGVTPTRLPSDSISAKTETPPPAPAPATASSPTSVSASTRSPAMGQAVAVPPARTPPPDLASAQARTTPSVPVQAIAPTSSPESKSTQSRPPAPDSGAATTGTTDSVPAQAATSTPSAVATPDSVSAPTGTKPPAPVHATPAPEPTRTSIPADASTAVSTPKPATIPPPQLPPAEAALTDEEVTIDLDELDHVIEQTISIEEAPVRDSVAVGDVLLNRYRLVALIGEGGMSRVFKATDSSATTPASPDTFIVVKVLTRPISEDHGSFASFRQEVQKLKGLTHPNIVRIFDCDRDGSTVFITMEYLAGPSLYTKLRGGAAAGKPTSGLGRDEAQYIILAVADALDYAHRSGVVHGDLKPGNVIVLNRGEVKVIDFDMVRWVAQAETGLERRESSQQKTSPAVTPSYASPQLMARQKPEPADDVYALACLAYELLTGSHPFDAGAGAQSLKFPPPRRAELSAPQYSALAHGLQPDRSDRTPTVRQFVAEFSAPESPAARKPGVIGRAIKPGVIGRAIKPGVIGPAIGVGAAALVFAVVAWFSVHRAPVPTPVPTVSSPAVPNPGTVIRDCPTCPAMTVLPAGRFKQGSGPDENGLAFAKPQHWVAVGRSFAMSTNAVTVDEFHEFITATGRDMQGCDTYDGEWKHRPKNNWKSPGFTQAGTHPVTCASWNDAEAYARWLSTETRHRYRLPSASEWEYAARAGGEAVQPWNADGSSACANANLADESAAHKYPGWTVFGCDDGYVYTAPVGSFKANSYGLNDMLGNVLQWTEDCWHADYNGAPIDGSARTDGNCSERELRGGSWFTTPAYVRADYRNHFAVDYRTSSVGIRLVRDIEQ